MARVRAGSPGRWTTSTPGLGGRTRNSTGNARRRGPALARPPTPGLGLGLGLGHSQDPGLLAPDLAPTHGPSLGPDPRKRRGREKVRVGPAPGQHRGLGEKPKRALYHGPGPDPGQGVPADIQSGAVRARGRGQGGGDLGLFSPTVLARFWGLSDQRFFFSFSFFFQEQGPAKAEVSLLWKVSLSTKGTASGSQ